MGKSISEQIPKGSFKAKLDALVHLLRERKIPASVGDQQALPVLEVHACPYPDLASGDGDRTLCELEAEVFSEALGVAVELSQCRLDGHGCCQFRQVALGGDSARANNGEDPA
jgi:predicted ArsR family transcriptional regulator